MDIIKFEFLFGLSMALGMFLTMLVVVPWKELDKEAEEKRRARELGLRED